MIKLPSRMQAPAGPLQKALRASRGAFGTVGGFSFLINLLMLTGPLYMLQVYDRVLASHSLETLLMLTIVAAGALLFSGFLDLMRSRVMVRSALKVDRSLSRRLIGMVMLQRVQGQDHAGAQPVRDLDTVRQFLSSEALLTFFDAPWTPLFIALIFLFHPLLGVVALLSAATLFSLALLNEVMGRGPSKEAGVHTMQSTLFVDKSLRNAEAMQAMGFLPAVADRWIGHHEAALGAHARAADHSGAVSASAKFVRQLVQVLMLGTGAYLAVQQVITPGVMIAASIILGRALAPLERSISSWRSFVSARTAYQRLSGALALTEDEAEQMALPAPEGRLRVSELVAAPPGVEKPVLRGLEFGVDPGEILAIIGPSAAGKSTLARLLVGVWGPRHGHVRLDGADVFAWRAEDLGPHVGYLPQDVELFEGTIAVNIARLSTPDPEEVVKAARLAGVHEMILSLEHGYDTAIGPGGEVLSGGQRQRIGLARALYRTPRLLVLDEPNASLDSQGEEALRQALTELKRMERTIVVISHRPGLVAQADKILVLNQGRMEMFGPRDEVLPRLRRRAVYPVGDSQSAEGAGDTRAEPAAAQP